MPCIIWHSVISPNSYPVILLHYQSVTLAFCFKHYNHAPHPSKCLCTYSCCLAALAPENHRVTPFWSLLRFHHISETLLDYFIWNKNPIPTLPGIPCLFILLYFSPENLPPYNILYTSFFIYLYVLYPYHVRSLRAETLWQNWAHCLCLQSMYWMKKNYLVECKWSTPWLLLFDRENGKQNRHHQRPQKALKSICNLNHTTTFLIF